MFFIPAIVAELSNEELLVGFNKLLPRVAPSINAAIESIGVFNLMVYSLYVCCDLQAVLVICLLLSSFLFRTHVSFQPRKTRIDDGRKKTTLLLFL